MDARTVLAPIIGAGIGYSTNWIAIKMLFRPYTEKKIMGIKIPFTPGLIPKERERVAKSVGQVIEEYLLTDKIIIDEMLKDKAKTQVLELVNNNIYNDDSNSINISKIIGENTKILITDKFVNVLVNKIIVILNQENVKNNIQEFIGNKISNSLKEIYINDILNEESLNNKYSEIINNNVRDIINEVLSEKISNENSINDIIDVKLIEKAKDIIINNIDNMINDIKIFENDKLREKAIGLIDSTIKEKVGALGAMFVNGENIYNTIAEKTKQKLQDYEVRQEIYSFVNKKIDDISSKTIDQIITDDKREELVINLVDYFTKLLLNIDISNFVSRRNLDIYSLIEQIIGDNTETKIKEYILFNYEKLINDGKTSEWINRSIVCFIDETISNDIAISDIDKQRLDTFIVEKYTQMVNTNMTKLVRDINLSSIIENQLNQFDIKMLEDIILSIAKKELNAITLLGGLLGFLIPFLAIFLYS